MRVLLVSPHPDDAEVFCGGTARLHVLQKHRVEEIILTRGERGTLPIHGPRYGPRRVEEARRAAEALGYTRVHQHDLGDMRVPEADAILTLRELADTYRPDLVYAPEPTHPFYKHPDHHAAGRAALEVFQHKVPLRLYHTQRPSHREDITTVYEDKVRAVKLHKTQRMLLEAGRIYTYINPQWAGLRGKTEEFRVVLARK
ncbi:MAG: PIG-L family deacetylase [Euryarchaeota archaeon]|nr:PIG-L family deacetylase [Euryarchaeota archaeon]